MVQQRQPQRTLSGPGLSQRPPHQRSLSQTYLPSPPTRSEGVGSSEPLQFPATDPPVVGDGGASSRHGGETLPPPPSASSKRSGSKLKLELLSSSGNDDLGLVQALMSESPLALDSATSRPFTPSRIMGPGGNGNGGGGGSSGGPAGYYGQDGGSDMGDMSPYHGGLGFPRIPAAATGETNSLPPLPMPPRRPQRPAVPPTPRREVAVGPTPPQLKKDGRPKPYVLDVPPDAPRYAPLGGRLLGGGSGGGELTNMDPPRLGGMRAGATGSGRNSGGDGAGVSKSQPARYADFFPWTGTHPEDQFSENVIRHGYFDKAPAVPQGESTSARPTMAAALKSKPSLLGLGSLLTAIMAQRRQNGQITATSTFKPPPRVTLTDAKREAWLHDLANPSFSLRRLSRTIPHGIRGKVLLEQCLAKNVPTDRAVWLAKCVGANEIRAFKRKGLNGALVLGGEAKWVRDWTVSVEQFVEAVVTKFTEPDWKTKTHYA